MYTCALVHDAREESIDAVLEAGELKKKGRCSAVLVAGCLPQRYKLDLFSALPEVDAFIGLDELERAGEVAARLTRGERRIVEVSESASAVIEPSPARLLFTGAPYAYVKVSEGCDHTCSFCAIPRIRGRYRSRPIKTMVADFGRNHISVGENGILRKYNIFNPIHKMDLLHLRA